MDPNSQNQNTGSVNQTPVNPVDTKDPLRSTIAKNQTRDSSGKFVSKTDPLKVPPITVTNETGRINTTNPPDLLNVKITNPLVYIKYWWKRIMANEGIDLRLRVKPLTVFGVSLIAFSLAFGLGGVVLPVAFPGLKLNNVIFPSPTPTPRPREPGTETIECVGPDGVHFQTTRKACDDLNNFWKNRNII